MSIDTCQGHNVLDPSGENSVTRYLSLDSTMIDADYFGGGHLVDSNTDSLQCPEHAMQSSELDSMARADYFGGRELHHSSPSTMYTTQCAEGYGFETLNGTVPLETFRHTAVPSGQEQKPGESATLSQLGSRGPLDPLLYLRANARENATVTVSAAVDAKQPSNWQPRQLSLPRDLLRKARESFTKRPRRSIANLLSQVAVPPSADVVGDLRSSTDGPCIDLLEDDSLHERWAVVLEGRQVDVVPEGELRWLVDSGTPLKHRHRLWRRWWAGPALGEVENLAGMASEVPCL